MTTNINVEGKLAGYISDNNVYITVRDEKLHFMRKFNGYGISKKVLEQIFTAGVKNIIIRTESVDYLFRVMDYIDSNISWNYCGDVQKFVDIDKSIK